MSEMVVLACADSHVNVDRSGNVQNRYRVIMHTCITPGTTVTTFSLFRNNWYVDKQHNV